MELICCLYTREFFSYLFDVILWLTSSNSSPFKLRNTNYVVLQLKCLNLSLPQVNTQNLPSEHRQEDFKHIDGTSHIELHPLPPPLQFSKYVLSYHLLDRASEYSLHT